MRLVGFNGRDIGEGTCQRGKKKDDYVDHSTPEDSAQKESGAMDHGFLDGALLWWLESEGIKFYIAKSNMAVRTDAISLIESENLKVQRNLCRLVSNFDIG